MGDVPASAVATRNRPRVVIGVDAGGTTIKALPVAIGPDGIDVLGPEARCPTPAGDPEAMLDAIIGVVETVRSDVAATGAIGAAGGVVDGLGVAVPGIIDEAAGVAVFAAVGWDKTPVVDRLGAATGLPVRLGHDVRAAGLAESRIGAARDVADALVVTIGTGVGAAVIAGGRVLSAGGYAGQLGHTSTSTATRPGSDLDGTPCGCGQRGCLGTVASASAVVRRYGERFAEMTAAAPDPGAEPEPGVAVRDAEQVAERAAAGDAVAVAVWNEAVEALALALARAVRILGSERVVLGGGMALAGEQLLGPVRARLHELAAYRPPEIVRAELGDRSGMLGAALLMAKPEGPE